MTREKLKVLLEEYGRVAIATYFAIFLLTMVGFALAITYGVNIESAKGGAGLLMASWIATKLTQPFRIAGTLALTPLIAAALKRLRKQPQSPVPAPPEGSRGL